MIVVERLRRCGLWTERFGYGLLERQYNAKGISTDTVRFDFELTR